MSNWRDTQLNSVGTKNLVLKQETCLLDFLSSIDTPKIFWAAPFNNLAAIVSEKYRITDNIEQADTVVIFNNINNLSVNQIQDIIKKYLSYSNIKNFYVGINRFAIDALPNSSLPDSIEESIDTLMIECDSNFKRITNFDNVSGAFFVFSHPMDLYTLCR